MRYLIFYQQSIGLGQRLRPPVSSPDSKLFSKQHFDLPGQRQVPLPDFFMKR